MKNRARFSIAVLFILIFYCDAILAQIVSNSFKKFSSYPCRSKQKNVFLFFERDTVTFKYKPLGTVEVSGKINTDDQEIIDRLKYTAYQNCANAVINIKTETITKNYGGEFRTDARTYTCRIYKGIAVRIESDSLYKSNKFGNSQDLSFIKSTINYAHAHKKRAVATAVVTVAVSALLVGIYMLKTFR